MELGPKPMRAGIALGSNLGDRLGHLQEGRKRLLALHDGSGPFLSSKIYETAPVDCPDGSQPFLNAAVEFSCKAPPLDLLATLQSIEQDCGRPPVHGFHDPRTLDLDFLYYDNLQLSHISLTLPHPRIADRIFVLKPLMDICPDRILLPANLKVRELCDKIELQADFPLKIKFASLFQ